jgi:hypothetical protein
MITTRIQHDFDCSEATLFEICFFDDEFNRRLYLEKLKFPVWRVIEHRLTDDKLERVVEVQPLVENVPAALRKLLGDRFGYREEGTLDRRALRYQFRVVPAAMADRTTITGVMYAEKQGDNRVRRVVEFTIDVRVFAVGKMVEQKTIDDTRQSYDKMAVFLQSYLRERAAKPGASPNPT